LRSNDSTFLLPHLSQPNSHNPNNPFRPVLTEKNQSSSLIKQSSLDLNQYHTIMHLKSIRDRAKKLHNKLTLEQQQEANETKMRNFLATIESVVRYQTSLAIEYYPEPTNISIHSSLRIQLNNEATSIFSTNQFVSNIQQLDFTNLNNELNALRYEYNESDDESIDFFDNMEQILDLSEEEPRIYNAHTTSDKDLSDNSSNNPATAANSPAGTSIPNNTKEDSPQVFNEAGKLMAKCPNCKEYFEAKHGVRAHLLRSKSCK